LLVDEAGDVDAVTSFCSGLAALCGAGCGLCSLFPDLEVIAKG
jgi:hypothetical protein